MDEMIGKLKLAYEMLQNLNVQPTRSNMRILCYAEDVIQQAHGMLTEIQANEQKNEDGGGENGTD